MGRIVRWLDRTLYPRLTSNWDNQMFRDALETKVSATHHVLDLGAGAGIVAQTRMRGRVERMCGVDPDPRVLQNAYLDEARLGSGEEIPYADASFDVVFSNNVLEHLARPEPVFCEIQRVLKPGGYFLAKTTNRYHYVPLIASCTPHWFHEMVNRWRGRATDDTFPTCYRANSPRRIRALARAAGLEIERVSLIEGRPEYLRLSAVSYVLGWAYERAVNSVPMLRGLRVILIAVLKKPSGLEQAAAAEVQAA